MAHDRPKLIWLLCKSNMFTLPVLESAGNFVISYPNCQQTNGLLMTEPLIKGGLVNKYLGSLIHPAGACDLYYYSTLRV